MKTTFILPCCLFLVTPNISCASSIKYSGFLNLTGGAVIESSDKYLSHAGYNKDFHFDQHSLMGLQAEFKSSDKLKFVTQLIGKANSEDNSGIEWLYLNYNPQANLSFKLGQLRTPFFNNSDVLDISYAYPWSIAPTEVYASFFFSHYRGADISYQFPPINETHISLQTYAGYFKGDVGSIYPDLSSERPELSVNFFSGLIAKLKYRELTIRSAYSSGQVDISTQSSDRLSNHLSQAGLNKEAEHISLDDRQNFYQLSADYDDLDYFIHTEWVKIKNDRMLLATNQSAFINLGLYWKELTIHTTYAKTERKLITPRPPLRQETGNENIDPIIHTYNNTFVNYQDTDSESIAFGVRWDPLPNLALKSDIKYVKNYYNSVYPNIKESIPSNNLTLLTFGLDWIF